MINTSRRELLRLQGELDALMALIARAEAIGTTQADMAYLRAQESELRRRLYG